MPSPDVLAPRVSVVLPLPDHRGHALVAIRSWLEQDCPAEDVQLVVISDGREPELARSAAAMLRAHDVMLTTNHATLHEAYNAGAADAAAELLLFTEAHVKAERNCVTRVLARMAEGDVELAALASGGIDENRLAGHEQTIYEEALPERIAEGWNLCTVRGFVVSRMWFERAGGFLPRYGHVAELLLGAALKHAGARLGYAPDARVWHFNDGTAEHFSSELSAFGRNEIRFRAEQPDSPWLAYLGPCPVWDAREAFRRGKAIAAVGHSLGRAWAALSRFNLKEFGRATEAACRLVPFIVLGPAWLSQRAAIERLLVYVQLVLGSVRDRWHYRAFRAFWISSIRRGRAEAVAEWLRHPQHAESAAKAEGTCTAPACFRSQSQPAA